MLQPRRDRSTAGRRPVNGWFRAGGVTVALVGAAAVAAVAVVPTIVAARADGGPAQASATQAPATASAADVRAKVDRVFAKWTSTTPGCAVGVSTGGRPVLEKAYGLADLEHDIVNTPETIFEAGSVSKQFTAAAVLLLARDGKLSLDDPVRKYIPELPDYGAPLTIRHMLTHTSGLRDWGSVEDIAGWPRTTRAYTHAHVLDIVSRQRALNFAPGTHWSYSNTGYNLSAILVSRVSGKPFAAFTRERIFEPLGMAHTSWRDDHTRVVKGRAVAYESREDGFHTLMPFEDVHGNGGLLTTVGDLLKWNENFVSPKVGDAAFVAEQQQAGRFNDGRAHDYAFGLRLGSFDGARIVEHSGATAGYRAHLVRFPDQHASVAVLCNVDAAQPTAYAYDVAAAYLGDRLHPPAKPKATHTLTSAEIDAAKGLYRNAVSGALLRLAPDGSGGLRIERGPALVAQSGSKLGAADGRTLELDGRGGLRVTGASGNVETFERKAPVTPTAADLAADAGTYASDEAETVLTVTVDDGALVLARRPATRLRLVPLYSDAFSHPDIGTVTFLRDGNGRATALSVNADRVWDLRFTRTTDTASSR